MVVASAFVMRLLHRCVLWDELLQFTNYKGELAKLAWRERHGQPLYRVTSSSKLKWGDTNLKVRVCGFELGLGLG